MPAIVSSVIKDSIADQLEISSGDKVLFINEIKPRDLIDYKFLTSEEEISIHIKHLNGEEEIIDIEKDAEEDLGINFESAVFDKVIPCTNKCIFCFVDQQPKGLRKSLYVKDDDWRLSYLQGTYITLTNINQEEKERIETLKPGPLYVSVHTTNPDLRVSMLKNEKAKDIMNELKWLNSLEIPVHAQIVLCPEINDGKELNKTLNDLLMFKSNILSIAVVPVGITKFRSNNPLSKVTKEVAEQVLEQINEFNKKAGFNMAYASDEFFILAEKEIPNLNHYGDFGQLDDGVGSCRLFLEDFNKLKKQLPAKLPELKEITLVTGEIAKNTLDSIAIELNKINNLKISVIEVKSKFWGDDVTVTGLITGQDMLNTLIPQKSEIKNLVIPSVMLKKFSSEFLDGITIADIEKELSANIIIIENYYSNQELVDFILN
jgi:putative radical SAM enzyme (TIGR03279 family)